MGPAQGMRVVRTAKMIQSIMLELFHVVVFVYVDDFFWVAPDSDQNENLAEYILNVFKHVVTGLLGWELDSEKESVGDEMLLLDIQVVLRSDATTWQFNPTKAEVWISEFQKALNDDHLPPALAAKFCGRIAFLNSTVFNRIGRALLRPLIWRQLQRFGQTTLTKRLRASLTWFIAVLKMNPRREIPYTPSPRHDRVILYSDADGSGGLAAVAIRRDTKIFMRGTVPRNLRKRLRRRKTNIVAFELIIAVAAMVSFCPEMLMNVDVHHYVDSQPAISCILKGSSPQQDLSDIAGKLWFECCHRMIDYTVRYVPSKCNLADGPSRGDTALLLSLGFVEVPFNLPSFKHGLNDWVKNAHEVGRLAV